MKISNTLTLASLFWTGSQAIIRLEDLPREVRAGSTQLIKFSNDRDYQLWDFYLVHTPHLNTDGWSQVEVVDHLLYTPAGNHSIEWKVPALKDQGWYRLWMNGEELHNGDVSGVPENATGYAAINSHFEIVGGPTLYPKEIAGVVVGTVAGMALIIGAFIVAARLIRKRRSLAVDLSEPEGQRYTDSPER